MTKSHDEQIKTLAKAILYLAKSVAAMWDYDGEECIGTGVDMGDLESELNEIIADDPKNTKP